MSKDTVDESWLWLSSGKKKLLKSSNPGPPRSFSPTCLSYDGTTGYRLVYTVEATPEVSGIDETPYEPKNINDNPIAQALGWIPLRHGTTVSTTELLQDLKNAPIQYESVTTVDESPSPDDERCIRVKLADVPPRRDGEVPSELVVWLSASHGYLPKRIALLPVINSQPAAQGPVVLPVGARPEILDICEFIEVNDPLFKQVRWFPKSVKIRGAFVYDVEVEVVEINQTISAAEFVPNVPFGAEIRNFSAGAVHPKISYQGGKEGQLRHQEQIASLSQSKTPEGTQTLSPSATTVESVVARPPFRWSLSIWLAAGSLLLLIAVLLIRRRA